MVLCLVRFGGEQFDLDEDVPLFRELDGIAQKIGEHLPQPQRIAFDRRWNPVVHLIRQVETFSEGAGGLQVERVFQAGAQIERARVQLQFPRLDLGKIQNVVDDGQQRFTAGMDGFEIAALLAGQRRFEEQADHGDDAIHGCADLVAHGREKFGLGAHGGFGGLAGLGQIIVVPVQCVVPAFRFQMGAQLGAKNQVLERCAHAITHPEIERAQFVRLPVRIGERNDKREGGRWGFL